MPEASSVGACASCGCTLTGPYCSQCGEETLDPHALTVRHFVEHTLIHEFTHVDGKIFRTFKCLLFRPGFLTTEYFAGRRHLYLNPVRVLMTALVIYALVSGTTRMFLSVGKLRLSLVPPPPRIGRTVEDTVLSLDVLGLLARELEKKSRSADVASEAAVEKFHHELKTYGTVLSFATVLLLSLLLFLLLRRRQPYFVEHLVFSLHLAAFLLLLSASLAMLLKLLGNLSLSLLALQVTAVVMFLLIFGAQIVYLEIGLLRFYYGLDRGAIKVWGRGSGPTWQVASIVLLMFIANSVFLTVVYAVGAYVALLRL